MKIARTALRVVFLALIALLVGLGPSPCAAAGNAAAASDRPNFVFIIVDDLSAGDLGCYGNEVIRTPNLDRMAAAGRVFDNAWLTISSCSPSRCSIITGRYPHNTGAPELHTALPASQHTFIHDFKQAGYHTVLSGKNHMADPAQLGFDAADSAKPAGSERWVAHLRNRPADKPFFFWFAPRDAHRPWQINDRAPEYSPAEVSVPPMLYDGPLTRQDLTGYYHEVSRVDHYVGEVLAELRRQGIADNTYIFFCADNGRPFPRCKTYLYASGLRTPLIVHGPGITAGRTDALVSSVDFAATLLDLAGLAKPPTVQGVSFREVLSDPSAKVRDVAFAERNWHVFQVHERAVRAGDWLYIWNAWPQRHNVSGESASWDFPAVVELWEMAKQGRLTEAQRLVTDVPQPREQLYHIKNDPHQFTNLADAEAHRDTLQKMRALLHTWQEQTGDSVPQNPTPDRESLHGEMTFEGFAHREFPGAANHAAQINQPGPVRGSLP